MGLIWFLLLGLVAGFIARALLPGRQKMGLLMTTALGCAGSVVGGFVGNLISNREATGPTSAGLIGSVIGAFVILLIVTAVARRRRPTTV